MPVVINDFEIVPEQAPPERGGETTAPAPPGAPVALTLSPLEVEHVLQFHAQRMARVTAC